MNIKKLAVPLVAITLLGGCASTTPGDQAGAYDPLEGFNRTMFTFNDKADEYVLEPVAKGYRHVLPEDIRNSVQNAVRHLESPLIFANQLLQGDLTGAITVVGRFVINTLVGLGGLVDVAARNGLPYEEEDFGQTLAVWGLGDGPYLVLPLLGPSNLRDLGGTVVDTVSDPVSIAAHNNDIGWQTDVGRTSAGVIDTRARLIEAVDEAKKSSVDYYATVRSFYKQQRDAEIKDGKVVDATIPDFNEETPAKKLDSSESKNK